MKKILIQISILLLLLISVFSASAQRKNSAFPLVPGESAAILRVNWTTARNDESLKDMVNGNEFANLIRQFGVDESKVGEWIVFSDLNPTSFSGMGILVSGAFTSQNVVRSVTERNWNQQTLGGQKVYVHPSDGSYLLPIRNGLFVAGTKTGVEKIQSVLVNSRNGLIGKQPFSALFAQLGGIAPVRFAIGIPQKYEKIADVAFKVVTTLMSYTGFNLLGTIFDKIGLIQSTGFSVSKGKTSFPVHLVATMPDAARAKIGAGALNLLKSLPQWMNSGSTPESAVLQSLIANSKGKLLSVKFDMPKSTMM